MGMANWVRIHGNCGLLENLRVGDRQRVRLRQEPFDTETGELEERTYLPEFSEYHGEALRTGHQGGDFFMNYHFAQAIRTAEPPFLDVYRDVAMSIVGILAFAAFFTCIRTPRKLCLKASLINFNN